MFLYTLINTYRANTSIPSPDQKVEHLPVPKNNLRPNPTKLPLSR